MTPLRWFYVAFWLFVGTMLAWQAYDYNANLVAQAQAAPPEKHYFYYNQNPNSNPASTGPAAHQGPYVVQKSFAIDLGVPPGSFTCHVTLQNQGTAKATSVQIFVRPYRGTFKSNPNYLRNPTPMSDDDPISMIGQWVAFPDLAPGQQVTQDVVFLTQPGIDQVDYPGMNPRPDIEYQPEKPQP